MAANEYVQAAAAQLENAANAVKQEMDQLRADFMTYERQATHDINTRDVEMRSYSARAATTAGNEGAPHLMLEVNRIKNEIDGIKKELETRRTKMNQDLKNKEGAMNSLMSQARDLYNKAASLR